MCIRDRYQDFRAPTVRILVDGTDITESLKTRLARVVSDLTCGYAAAGVSFDVMGEYDYEPVSYTHLYG